MRRFLVAAAAAAAVLLAACSGSAPARHRPREEEREPTVRAFAPSGSCGIQRWDVKTGTDSEAANVNLTPTKVTIHDLASLAAHPAATGRVSPTEDDTYQIAATLVGYKLEGDSDYHLVIRQGPDSMIVEIPSPACVGSTSPFRSAIEQARAAFDAQFTPTGTFHSTSVPVTVVGVGFFDSIHGQTGVAPNGVELHPVLSVSFGG